MGGGRGEERRGWDGKDRIDRVSKGDVVED